MIAHHVGTPTTGGIAWESVAERDDGTHETRRATQEGLSPLRPPFWEGADVQRVDVPGLQVRPEKLQRTLGYWLEPGVSDRACHHAELVAVHGGVPLCVTTAAPIVGDVRPAGDIGVGPTVAAGGVFVVACVALVVLGRWLSRRAKDEAREAYLRRELS